MSKIRCVALCLSLATLSLLAGCGNKGDLVHPAPPADAAAAG